MTINNTTVANNLYPVANATASSNPFIDQFNDRDPSPQDINYPIQKKWLNTSSNTYWELKEFTAFNGITSAVWIKIASQQLVESLTGNSGGAVLPVPVGSNNIFVVGDGTFITTVGTPLTGTLTIEPAGGLATSYVEDTGTAVPAAGVLNVLGGTAIHTVGSGNTITINGKGVAYAYTNVVGPVTYVVLSTDYYISCDPSGGAITLNFPNAPTANQIWIVKDRTGAASTHNITLATPGGTVTFDGSTSYTIVSNHGSVNLLANATPTYEIF